jgi:CRP-like cAMP-binding protein
MLHAGQFFGEMALISGDARAATVIAKTDVECYRLDRASFQELLAGKPQIAEEIGRVMGGRRGDLDSARQAFTVAPAAQAEVLYEPQNGAAHVIGMLHAGQFFGEMALLTGDARAATVLAKTDVECYRLDRASFQELLASKPEIGEEIKRVMGGRRGDLDSARQAFVAPPPAEAEVRLSTRIRRFLLGG